jgi:hypothetical protein
MLFGGKKKMDQNSENAKICPFYFEWVGGETSSIKLAKCLKEKCMLWNPEEQDCNINVIAKRLPVIQEILR